MVSRKGKGDGERGEHIPRIIKMEKKITYDSRNNKFKIVYIECVRLLLPLSLIHGGEGHSERIHQLALISINLTQAISVVCVILPLTSCPPPVSYSPARFHGIVSSLFFRFDDYLNCFPVLLFPSTQPPFSSFPSSANTTFLLHLSSTFYIVQIVIYFI